MIIGNVKTKAPRALSLFVLICSVVTVGLLFIMQKSEATGEVLSSRNDYKTLLTE